MNEDGALVATPSQTVGPFFHVAVTAETSRGRMVDPDAVGEQVQLLVRVTDGDGAPVTDALVELWQADAPAGQAAAVPGATGPPAFRFGRLATGEDGACEFETVRPGKVPDGLGGMQAAHINVYLFARGLLRQLHTRVYFAGDPALGQDAALALVPEDRRPTLLACPDGERPGRWLFEVRLQGAQETVFFDG